MDNLEVYIKPTKKYIANKTPILVSDVCQVFVSLPDATTPDDKQSQNIADKIRNMILVKKIPDINFTTVSGLDILRAIKKEYPKATITNMGEDVTLISLKDKYDPLYKKYIKAAFISIILFAGCASAIITFHIDTQLNRLFNTYAHIINIDHSMNSVRMYMEIPYAIGIASGIILFFNHIFGKKLTKDPTPIEVEMSTYEADVVDALIDNSPAEG